jgi:hypothetical protein
MCPTSLVANTFQIAAARIAVILVVIMPVIAVAQNVVPLGVSTLPTADVNDVDTGAGSMPRTVDVNNVGSGDDSKFGRRTTNMSEDVYNQYTAKHGKEALRVGHDMFMRWYVVKDKEWKMIEDARTQKQAHEAAHHNFHNGDTCKLELEWILDRGTRAPVLGECPECLNPEMDSDFKTYRSCPDCGWRIDFTKDEIERLERMLKEPAAW